MISLSPPGTQARDPGWIRPLVVTAVASFFASVTVVELGLGQVFRPLLMLIIRIKDLWALNIPDVKRARVVAWGFM